MRQASTFLSAVSTYLDYGIRLDFRVLMYTLSAGLFVILLSGLAPARHAVRLELAEVLKSEQGTGATGGGWQKKALIVGQIAVSVALFGTAAMFLLSLRNAAAIRPGFEPDKRLLIIKVFPGRRMQTSMWCEQACERLSGLPGVRAATYARRMALSGSGGGATVQLEVPGQPPLGVFFNNVGGNYFNVMGTRVIAGRGISASDREGGQPVVVISRHLAHMLSENRNPLGEWFLIAGKLRQVVGVAEDAPSNHLHEEPEPYLYLPFTRYQRGEVTLIVETVGEPAAMTRAVGQEVTRFDPRAMVYSAITLHDHMDNALSEDRMMAILASGLGVFGILLTCAGLFGVVQHAVNRRTREFGVRLALGAEPASIRRMVLVESMRLGALGIPFGLMLLVASVRYLHSMVLGISPLNPALYVGSAAAAIAVAFAAGWFPAQRATRVDPIQALRQE
jgi:predicted permease